jgi:hypothetical protein
MKNLIAVVLLAFVSIGAAQAALVDRGGGFIYDDVLNITWTQDANLATWDSWDNQITWADSLSLYDSVRDVTWTDWRLASIDLNENESIANCTIVSEVACRDNELGYLNEYYGISSVNEGLFTEVQSWFYWTGTDDSVLNAGVLILGGTQGYTAKSQSFAAWAVRDGDVVPIPAAVWLFGSALAGLGWIRRRSQA